MRPKYFDWSWVLCTLAVVILAGCHSQTSPQSTLPAPSNRVVLYCSVDEVYAKPIIKDLEKRTGLRIDTLFDSEAAKTAGLANRIRAEKAVPRGDVFWSSALLQTLLLQREGLLQAYVPASSRAIPAAFKDRAGFWTGVGARRRLIVWHGSANSAGALNDLLQPRFRNRVGISNPQFGTASDWVAAMGVRWGMVRTQKYFRGLKRNGVQVLPGNALVAERVGRGDLWIGVTDTDDFWAQAKRYPALSSRDSNTRSAFNGALPASADNIVVPGSVAILAGAPHRAAAQKLVEALTDARTEKQLNAQMRGVNSVRDSALKSTPDDTAQWPAAWDKLREPLTQILLAN